MAHPSVGRILSVVEDRPSRQNAHVFPIWMAFIHPPIRPSREGDSKDQNVMQIWKVGTCFMMGQFSIIWWQPMLCIAAPYLDISGPRL
jgi:hypothetical protein